jgi:uncharacterized protein YbjQ (UPF0145 family)
VVLFPQSALAPALFSRTKAETFRTALVFIVLILLHSVASAADNTNKEYAKAEERMRDEKRQDEQRAKDHATRVKVARFDSVWRPPGTNDIDVVQAHESVSNAYKSIALLTYECETKAETDAVAGFISKARDLGADGVLLIGIELPSIQHANILSPDARRVFRANAIVYQRKE